MSKRNTHTWIEVLHTNGVSSPEKSATISLSCLATGESSAESVLSISKDWESLVSALRLTLSACGVDGVLFDFTALDLSLLVPKLPSFFWNRTQIKEIRGNMMTVSKQRKSACSAMRSRDGSIHYLKLSLYRILFNGPCTL